MLLSKPIRGDGHAPRGFTLLELLLTLGVLAAIAALVVPLFGDLLSDRRLARGGEVVRVEMTRARLEAMISGRTQMMRIHLGTDEFSVEPWYSSQDMTEATEMAGSGSALLTGGTVTAAPTLPVQGQQPVEVETLPEGITFGDVRVEATARSMVMDMQSGAEGGAAANQGGADWGQPILFYADGTTSTAAVTVVDQVAGRVVVTLRGLTGEATPTEVQP